MPEPFQKGNSAEYVREWERIFRPLETAMKEGRAMLVDGKWGIKPTRITNGVKPKGWTFCPGCGSLTAPIQVPEGWVCTVCGDVRVSRKEE
jgi:hypothetical protein